jgi:regulator of protease activity HflC (stomatin/prohibitin superfamily)
MDALILALLPLIALALAGLRRVPAHEVHVLLRHGRYLRALPPGLHWVVPGLDRIGQRVGLIGHHVALPARLPGDAEGTADLYYQILDPARAGDALAGVDEWVRRQADDALATLPPPAEGGAQACQRTAEALKAELNRRIGRQGLRVIRCALHPLG